MDGGIEKVRDSPAGVAGSGAGDSERGGAKSGSLTPRKFFLAYRRCAIRVERLDCLQTPGLPLFSLRLGPPDGLPIRREDQASARVGDLHTITARLIDIKKECLL